MARERMVTRTINESVVEIMTLDVTTANVEIKAYRLSGIFTDDEALKKCKKMYETETLKLVHVESNHTTEVLYGMLEDDFIRYAEILPPR